MSGSRPRNLLYEALKDYYLNNIGQKEVAEKYNMSTASVSRLCNGVRYKDIYTKFMEEYSWVKNRQ